MSFATWTRILVLPLLLVVAITNPWTRGWAEHNHEHMHGAQTGPKPKPPRIFLNKNARIVWYQLNRLNNQRLLLVEREPTDAKYRPVYEAILIRPGMSRQARSESLAALVKISTSNPVRELLSAFETLKTQRVKDLAVPAQLARMLVSLPSKQLKQEQAELQKTAKNAKSATLRAAAMAGTLALDDGGTTTWQQAQGSATGREDFLAALLYLPASKRIPSRGAVLACLATDQPTTVRAAAIKTLAATPGMPGDNFNRLAEFIAVSPEKVKPIQQVAIRGLLKLPREARDTKLSQQLLMRLVAQAEATPAAKRTTDDFVDMMQLCDQLIAVVDADAGKKFRQRLNSVSVRVVKINTVEEEMRYDVKHFAVAAGRPVQIVLHNEDLMPHNLVITQPGALKEVALAGALLPQKQFVPDSDKVLFATKMVQSRQQVRLTFTAPTTPGEYPFVCTFPRHWMRMYGVMVVVEDLDAYLRNPTEPKDPLGNNRSFVKKWTLDDFPDLTAGLQGRTEAIGARIFKEATCRQCHKLRGDGGAVGPDITEVFKRWKNDPRRVLQEVLDPSHHIDPKYAVQIIATAEGTVISGIVVEETKSSVTLVTDPEAKKPTVLQRDDIDEITKSSKSLMPKALLDRFTKDEIFELMSFIRGGK